MPGTTSFRSLPKIILAVALALHALACLGSVALADETDANKIAQAAARAQNAGEIEIALVQWEKLIAQHTNYSQIGLAHYQAGYCKYQLKQFSKAIEHLESAIKKTPADQKVSLAQSYLFLGDAESKLGKQLRDSDPQAAKQLLTTATQTFATMLRKYPEFQDADQAWYFQGEAFEALQRFDDAANSYSNVIKAKESEFKLDAQYGLGYINEKQGKYESAHKLYNEFESAGQRHSSYNEVRFRNGEVLMELSDAALQRGEKNTQLELLQIAAQKFSSVYDARDPKWSDRARFQQANATQLMGQFGKSAELYDSVVQISGSKLIDQARVYAGRDYYRAGKFEIAAQTLEKAVSVPSPFSATAARWLADLYLDSDQAERAYSFADRWIEKARDSKDLVPLMISKAAAAYALEDRQGEASLLYLDVFKKHPDHSLAPMALYNAAFTELKRLRYDDALEFADQFKSKFPQSEYLPDVLEVEGDSYFLSDKAQAAEKTFKGLISQFPNNDKANRWKLRTGQILFEQNEFEQTINWLTPLTQQLRDQQQLAEALHWIGSSQFKLGKNPEAIANLQNSMRNSKSWRRADETMMTLSQVLYADKQFDESKRLTVELNQQFPKSGLVAKAKYRLAEIEYKAENYAEALRHYVALATNHGDSEYAPYAKYGIGWSQIQLGQHADSAAAFTDLIESHPQHELATQALIGRASSLRQDGKPTLAINDLDRFLATNPVAEKEENALYEKGLSQIALKKWSDVVSSFSELVALAPKSSLADRYHYELAWALRETDDRTSALKHFQTIARQWPKSSLAPESYFHVAQAAYGAGQYDEAIAGFESCMKGCTQGSKIHEKAIYKLAWAYYKKKDYENALASFRKQIELFPQGSPLHADGVFMVSEALYESNKFSDALQQYRVAKPIIETSTTVSPNYRILTFLHGAQSANKSGEHREAISFAQSLVDLDVDKNVKRDAYMEMGDARRALKEYDDAIKSYEMAARHPGVTGARSMCMIGEIKFDQKKFKEAVNRFKLVLYDYGGTESIETVKPWQAFAAYEAGRCHFVQISSAEEVGMKKFHVEQAKKHFEYLTENYSSDKLASKAKSHLQDLSAVK